MRRPPIRIAALSALLATAWTWAQTPVDRDVVFQVSTLSALMEGAYDGLITCGELLQHGDFGIGTFEGLDGEMVVTDGIVYRIPADGRAQRVEETVRSPFAVITHFDPDLMLMIEAPVDLTALRAMIDAALPTPNLPYAVRVTGFFDTVQSRSVPAQARPYPRLVEVVKTQPVFNLERMAGTLVGYRLPAYMDGINVAGYHLHFLNRDATAGGHLLDCRVTGATVTIDVSPRLFLSLPEQGAFAGANLHQTTPDEVKQVEGK